MPSSFMLNESMRGGRPADAGCGSSTLSRPSLVTTSARPTSPASWSMGVGLSTYTLPTQLPAIRGAVVPPAHLSRRARPRSTRCRPGSRHRAFRAPASKPLLSRKRLFMRRRSPDKCTPPNRRPAPPCVAGRAERREAAREAGGPSAGLSRWRDQRRNVELWGSGQP